MHPQVSGVYVRVRVCLCLCLYVLVRRVSIPIPGILVCDTVLRIREMMRGSNCPDHPVPILWSANRNLYRAFQFQESLVRDHTPRCPLLDSKRVCASCMFMCVYIDMYTCHWDPLPCATVKVPHFYLSTFQGRANTHARLIYLSFFLNLRVFIKE